MPEADLKQERDLQRLDIDFEKSTPLAEWEYREVTFFKAGQLTTIRHKILGQGRIIFVPVHWRLKPEQTVVPSLYTILGEPLQFPGYIKVRATAPGRATVLIGLRRDG